MDLGKGRKKRVSKAEWLEAALNALERDGIDGVKIERLARTLGIAKSGFYWHFRDRLDLLDELLKYWDEEFTGIIAANPEIREMPARERLRTIMELVLEHDLSRYDSAIEAWARCDPRAARVFRRVYRNRLKFLRQAFRDLGLGDEEATMRGRLFVVNESFQRNLLHTESKASLRRLTERRLDLYTRPERPSS